MEYHNQIKLIVCSDKSAAVASTSTEDEHEIPNDSTKDEDDIFGLTVEAKQVDQTIASMIKVATVMTVKVLQQEKADIQKTTVQQVVK